MFLWDRVHWIQHCANINSPSKSSMSFSKWLIVQSTVSSKTTIKSYFYRFCSRNENQMLNGLTAIEESDIRTSAIHSVLESVYQKFQSFKTHIISIGADYAFFCILTSRFHAWIRFITGKSFASFRIALIGMFSSYMYFLQNLKTRFSYKHMNGIAYYYWHFILFIEITYKYNR